MRRIIPAFPFISVRFGLIDAIIFLFFVAVVSLIVYVASGWRFEISQAVEINLHPVYIPLYSANSLVRMFFAYLLSLLFSILYGYLANRSKTHEKVMIPLLDVLQSIPVLSFLPSVTLAMIAIFPDRRLGIELASILLIFTGQVWNMAFSYYNSISTIPRELTAVTTVFKHNRFTKVLYLDLPFSAIGMVWNSMMSAAGGWFFLMACEMFVLGDKDFRLPGIGSYIQTAANHGDLAHILLGIGTMVVLIVILDLLVWRPLVAWSQKFRFDMVQPEEERESLILDLLRRSALAEKIGLWGAKGVEKAEALYERGATLSRRKIVGIPWKSASILFPGAALLLLGWSLVKAFALFAGLSYQDYSQVFVAAFYSILRTTAAIVIAFLWTVPVGVYIGTNPRASKMLQPVVQVVASIPATAVFPVILLFLIRLGGGLDTGSIFLMLLGTQWYLLFNVIAGATAIPQDLREVSRLYGVTGFRKWRTLILPGIFPYLITGLITATGGAWNATIVSEYVTFGGNVLKTDGLGSLISQAIVSGNFGLLFVSTVTMAAIVVSINRLLWKRLFALAREKYRLD